MPMNLGVSDAPGRVAVERAIAEMRMARPVLIDGESGPMLVSGIEDLTPAKAARLDEVAAASGATARLVLPAARLRRLGSESSGPGSIALPRIDVERVRHFAFTIGASLEGTPDPAGQAELDALELARLALALPAVLAIPLGPDVVADPAVIRVPAADIRDDRAARVRDLAIVARAPVPLEGATETEFVVFRGGEGLRDQVAVVVGRPDLGEPVLVRMHSACLTGDLFGSLKCDCGDQLRGSVRLMAENGGGVLLYLDQEGRGNGIANKIRAYRLQSQGYDTYDADEMLGFGPDQRRFDFAAAMLRQLGIARVRLITNNPDKIAALEGSGIAVVAHERILGRRTVENRLYLASKRERAGHMLEPDGAPRSDAAE